MLEILTFTGVDRVTSLPDVVEIAARHPQVEFGVLVGSETQEYADNGIFPPLPRVREFRALDIRTSLHLCGKYARQAMNNPIPSAVLSLCEGFSRVQLNLHGDRWNPRRVDVTAEAVRRFADAAPAERIILQHRAGWEDVPVVHPAVEYLFDRSEGAGREAFHEWPSPPEHGGRVGYAGGIGPHNIGRVMQFVEGHRDNALWLDMEGNVRTGGWLDLDAVREVCRIALGCCH